MIRPLGTRVVIQPLAQSEKVGSIFIPDTAKEMPREGTVLAVGPEVDTVRVGERVLFGKFSVDEVKGYGVLLAWAKDLMGVIEG